MPEITVVIGVSLRPDQKGEAHKYDMGAVEAAQHLFDGRTFQFGLQKNVTIKVSTKAIPSVQNPGALPSVRSGREDYGKLMSSNTDIDVSKDFGGVDLLYIPGGPVAAATQGTDVHKMKANSGIKKEEADSRGPFELKIIESAMARGIPVLAVCAGSWRLLEACGGRVRELSATDVARHRQSKNPWSLHHDLNFNDDGRVTNEARSRELKPNEKKDPTARFREWSTRPDYSGSNSTHWAVADEADGELTRHAVSVGKEGGKDSYGQLSSRHFLNPSEFLKTVAREPVSGTVEGFESQFGAPLLGLQWHPESYQHRQEGEKDELSKNGGIIQVSQEIFRLMILSAVASKCKRQFVVPELRKIFDDKDFASRLKPPPKRI